MAGSGRKKDGGGGGSIGIGGGLGVGTGGGGGSGKKNKKKPPRSPAPTPAAPKGNAAASRGPGASPGYDPDLYKGGSQGRVHQKSGGHDETDVSHYTDSSYTRQKRREDEKKDRGFDTVAPSEYVTSTSTGGGSGYASDNAPATSEADREYVASTSYDDAYDAGERKARHIASNALGGGDKADTVNSRIHMVEAVTGGTLPSYLARSLAENGTLDARGLKVAATELARQYELPTSAWARPLTDKQYKEFGLNAHKKYFLNPATGLPITMKEVQNLNANKGERLLFQNLLRGVGSITVPGQKGEVHPQPDLVAAAWQMIASSVPSEEIDASQAMGLAITVAATFGKDRAAWNNFAANLNTVNKFGVEMTAEQKIGVAYTASIPKLELFDGGPMKDGADVAVATVFTRDDLTQEQKQRILSEIDREKRILASGEVTISAGRGGTKAPIFVENAAGKKVLNPLIPSYQREAMQLVLGRQLPVETYNANLNKMLATSTNRSHIVEFLTPSRLEWVGHYVDMGLDRIMRTQEAVLTYYTSKIDWLGQTVGGVPESQRDASQRRAGDYIYKIMEGEKGAADYLKEEIGLNPGMAEAGVFAWDILTDPLNLAGSAVGGLRKAKLVADAMAKGKEYFAAKVINLVDDSHVMFGGKSLNEFVLQGINKAIDTNSMDALDHLNNAFGAYRGGPGLHGRLVDLLYNFVKKAKAAGMAADEISEVTSDFLKGAFGLHIDDASPARRLLDDLRQTREARTLAGAARRLGGEVVPPATDQPWLLESAANDLDDITEKAFSELNNLAGQGSGVPSTGNIWISEFPHRRILRIGDRINWVLGDTQLGKSFRSLGSKLSNMVLDLENNFAGSVEQMALRSGMFTREEVSRMVHAAYGIGAGGASYREARFLKFAESMQEEMMTRILRDVGIEGEDALPIVKQWIATGRASNAEQAFGTTAENLTELMEKGYDDVAALRNPQFETQLPNQWIMMDPIKMKKAVHEALALRDEGRRMVAKAFGRTVKGGKTIDLDKVTARMVAENWGSYLTHTFNRYWKPATVMSPRYVLRVPMMDEQLRFFADLGFHNRIIGARMSSRIKNAMNHIPGVNVGNKMQEFNVGVHSYEPAQMAVDAAGFKNVDDAFNALRKARATGVVSEEFESMPEKIKKLFNDALDKHEARLRSPRIMGYTREEFTTEAERLQGELDNLNAEIKRWHDRDAEMQAAAEAANPQTQRKLYDARRGDFDSKLNKLEIRRTKAQAKLSTMRGTGAPMNELGDIRKNAGWVPDDPTTEDYGRMFDELQKQRKYTERGANYDNPVWWEQFGYPGAPGNHAFAIYDRQGNTIYINHDPAIWGTPEANHPWEWQSDLKTKRDNAGEFDFDDGVETVPGEEDYSVNGMLGEGDLEAGATRIAEHKQITIDHETGHVVFDKIGQSMGDDLAEALGKDLSKHVPGPSEMPAHSTERGRIAGNIDDGGFLHESFSDAWTLWKNDPRYLERTMPETYKVMEANADRIQKVIDGSGFRTIHVDPQLAEDGIEGGQFVIKIPKPLPGQVMDELSVNSGNMADYFKNVQDERRNVLQSMGSRQKSGAHFYGLVRKGDKQYYPTLEKVLRNDVAKSALGRRVLRGIATGEDSATVRKALLEWAESRAGRRFMGRMGRLDSAAGEASVEGLIEQAEFNVRAWVGNNPEIADMVLNIDPGLEQALKAIPKDELLDVHGFAASTIFGKDNPGTVLYNFLSKWTFEMPTNRLSRQPFFKTWYTKQRSSLLKAAAEQGLSPDDAMLRSIDGAARDFARQRTLDVMFDFRQQARWAEMMNFIAPFMQPYAEAFTVWGRLLYNNPGFAARGLNAFRQMGERGILVQDENGQWNFPLTNMFLGGWLLNNVLFPELKKGGPWTMTGPLQGMNFIFGSMIKLPDNPYVGKLPIPIPSLNPPAMAVAQFAADSDSIPDAWKMSAIDWANQYGDLKHPYNFASGLLPSGLSHLVDSFVPDSNIIRSLSDNFAALYEKQGMTPEQYAKTHNLYFYRNLDQPNEEKVLDIKAAQRALQKQAEHDARELIRFRAVMGFLSPVAPSVQFPTEDLRTEFQNLARDFGYDEARSRFHEKYDGEYDLITLGTTTWEGASVALPATESIDEFIRTDDKFQQFMKDNPRWAFALIPQEFMDDPYKREAFFRQMDDGERRAKTVMELYSEQDMTKGWDAWRAAREAWNHELDVMDRKDISQSSNEYDIAYDQYKDEVQKIKDLYPGFADDIDTFEKFGVDPHVMESAKAALKSEAFRETSIGQALTEYMVLRQRVQKIMVPNNIQTLDTWAGKETGALQMYEKGVQNIMGKFPDFEQVYQMYFGADLRNPDMIDTEGELWIDSLTPKQAREQQNWSVKWEKLRNRASNADTSVEAAPAYLALREMANSAFEEYGRKQNPLLGWWRNRTLYERDQYTNSVGTRPYVFLSEFDRRVVLNERTNPKAEAYWLKLGNHMAQIAKLPPDAPSELKSRLYDEQNRMARQFASHSKVFAKQLAHANSWGWAFEKARPEIVHESSQRGEAWRTFLDALANAQHQLSVRDAHFIDSPDPQESLIYESIKARLAEVVERLKNHSYQFQVDWNKINQAPGYALDRFYPDFWFKLGGNF